MQMSDEPRCLIIDRQPAIRLGVRGLLAERYEIDEAENGREALELLSFNDFDVVIVELAPANGRDSLSGMQAIRAIRKASPPLGIVAHGARPQKHSASEALDAGATAYVAKSSEPKQLMRAVEAAADAETFVDPAARRKEHDGLRLTRRQREILQLYANGLSTENAAKRLGLSTETVRTHTKAVLQRLEARDRTHAVAIGLRSSLIE
jgi:two-component system, NarL family, response regulator